MVMGGDSFSEGHGFESQHHILDGHFLIGIGFSLFGFLFSHLTILKVKL